MAQSGIKIDLKGFDDLLERIEKAGKDVDAAAAQAIKECAALCEAELKASCAASNVPNSITKEIRKKVTASGGTYEAEIGWELEGYNPRQPSTGYKAIFLNYGTVRRETVRGKNRGKIPSDNPDPKAKRSNVKQNFIGNAKKAAKPKIRKAQQRIIDTVKGDIGK